MSFPIGNSSIYHKIDGKWKKTWYFSPKLVSEHVYALVAMFSPHGDSQPLKDKIIFILRNTYTGQVYII